MAFLELLFWAALLGGWHSARAVVPSLELHRPDAAPLLLTALAATVVMAWHLRWRHRVVGKLADAHLVDTVYEEYRMFRPTWKFLLWRWALGAAIVGWLDPKMGSRLEEVESEGVDVMVAVDVSNSMLAEDVGMPRIDLAKRTVERLTAAAQSDRLGLVVFAGDAFVQCPLTTDIQAIKLFLKSVDPGMVPTQGTAVGNAVETCMRAFDPNSEASPMIVVMTDGENHEDDVVEACSMAKQEGASVHFLGLGSLEGSPIPQTNARGKASGFKVDEQGNPVVSKLDEGTLTQAAQAGGGTYARASRGFVDISPILAFRDDLETARIATVSYVDF